MVDEGSSRAPSGWVARLTPRRDPYLLVKLLLFYGVAILVITFVAWAWASSPSGGGSVPCAAESALPAPNSTLDDALAVNDTAFPPPANGSVAPETFTLWINTTSRLPGPLAAGFEVQELPGSPSPAGCELPIPPSSWVASPATLDLSANAFDHVAFVGTPSHAYDWSGVHAAEVWVNATSGDLPLGHLYVELEVG